MRSENSELDSLIHLFRGTRVVFLSHVRPDLDTLASAMALTHFFSPIAKTTWGVVEPLSDSLESQINSFPLSPILIDTLKSFDCVVCVDFRSPLQAGPLSEAFRSFKGKIIIIDHHSPPSRAFPRVDFTLIKPHAIATAQMVAQMGMRMNVPFPKKVAAALASAMITDSARFLVANEETFTLFDFLLQKSGKPYEELLSNAVPTPSVSERVTILHSLKHAKLISMGNFTLACVALPHQSSFVASALVQLGNDVGMSASHSPHGLFVSLRVSGRAHSEIGFDAVKTLSTIALAHDGVCGGHPRAAQLNLPPYFSEQMIIDVIVRDLLACVRKSDRQATLRVH